MTLGIDASRAYRDQKTGVDWYAYHLIEQLKTVLPKDVHVFLYSEHALPDDLDPLPENWESKVLHWPPKRLWTQLRLSMEMLFHPPDVLFVPAHVFPLIHPRKTVMTLHDTAAEQFPEAYSCFERWYSLWAARWGLKTLWRMIVPSEFVKKEIAQYGSTERVHVVHHGFDHAFYRRDDAAALAAVRKKYNLSKPFLLSIGRLEEKKNTRRLVEAFRRIDADMHLLLVGKPGYGFEAVRMAILESPRSKDIIHPGWIEQADMPLLMNAAEVFVFPSLYEGFGIPVLEAFACETPVVAARGTSIEEIGQDAVWYCNPKDTDDIARAIQKALAEKGRSDNIAMGAARAAQFSWERCARETARILIENTEEK